MEPVKIFVKCEETASAAGDAADGAVVAAAAAAAAGGKRGVGRLVDSTQADDRRMIYLVRERPLLYARSNLPVASYHSQVKKLWREVADIMGWTERSVSGRMELDQDACRRLIALYAAQRALWHPAEQGDKREKARAWARLSARMAAPVPDLKRKMDSLLGSYRREKSRERQHIPGAGRYKSRWYAYKLFQFLADRPRSWLECTAVGDDAGRENGTGGAKDEEGSPSGPDEPEQVELVEFIKAEPDSEADMQLELEPERGASPPPERAASPLRLRRRRKLVRAKMLARKLCKVPRGAEADPLAPPPALAASSHDAHLAFGLYVASELRKYDAATLVRVKRAICDLIYSTDGADCDHQAS